MWGEKGSAWKRAKKVKLMVEATAAVEEMSADLFMRHKMATLIQSHIRMFLVRARMGMRPGDSLVSESPRQMVQTVLAERRLAEALPGARAAPDVAAFYSRTIYPPWHSVGAAGVRGRGVTK